MNVAAAPGASAPASDPAEIAKFDQLAPQFWDPAGPLHTLHALNPVRIAYVAQRARLAGSRALDVGCGGGLLSEALARAGAQVTGIDLSSAMIEVARLHATDSALTIDYRLCGAAELAASEPGHFDVVTCMELIEHVPDPGALVHSLAQLLRPGGECFISTINRNVRSFALAIVGAEYVLRLVPRGTHEYARLLRPSELAAHGREAGLRLCDVSGLHYNPLTRAASLTSDVRVNYLMHLRREANA